MIKGCDISHHQNDKGKIDYTALRAAADFLIVKATEGIGFKDPNYRENIDGFRGVGGMVGHYHFARPERSNSAEAEAKYFIDCIKSVVSDGEILVLDFESPYPTPNAVSWCKQWLDYVYLNMNNTRPLLYLNKRDLAGYDWSDVVAAGYGLWVADYDNDPDSPPPFGKWPFAAMKQYTNSLSVPGIVGGVDGNAFYGTHDAFKKYGYYRPSDNSNGGGGDVGGDCAGLAQQLADAKKDLEIKQIENSRKLAENEVECNIRLSTYKQKLIDLIKNAEI